MKYKLLSAVCEYRKDRISSKKVDENNYISTENMLPDKKGVEKASSIANGKTLPAYKEGDILLSNIRPYFKKIWFANKTGGCSNDVLVLKSNDSVDKKFLYYVLSDNNFFNYSTVTSKGTKMPRGSKHAIMKYLVPDIDLPTQKRIADVLSAYDDLIENNNKRIALLEKAAQELYKEWFVRFRFPGHEKAKFVNGLPEGWSCVKLGEYANISTGKCNREDAEDEGIYPLFDRSQEIKKSNVWIKDCEAIIVPGEGTSFIPRYFQGKFNLHQRCYCVEPKLSKIGKFLYQILMLNRIYFLYVATGATVPSLRQNNFTSMKILMPEISLVNKFDDVVSSFMNEINSLNERNKNLIKQRDLLLPRLMSGKLEV